MMTVNVNMKNYDDDDDDDDDVVAAAAADDDEGDSIAVEEGSLGPEDVVEDGILAVVVAATLETVVLSAGLSSVKFCLELS